MLDYRLMTIDDYEAAYDLWIKCGNGLNNKDVRNKCYRLFGYRANNSIGSKKYAYG